jgi:hypothetical protein
MPERFSTKRPRDRAHLAEIVALLDNKFYNAKLPQYLPVG